MHPVKAASSAKIRSGRDWRRTARSVVPRKMLCSLDNEAVTTMVSEHMDTMHIGASLYVVRISKRTFAVARQAAETLTYASSQIGVQWRCCYRKLTTVAVIVRGSIVDVANQMKRVDCHHPKGCV